MLTQKFSKTFDIGDGGMGELRQKNGGNSEPKNVHASIFVGDRIVFEAFLRPPENSAWWKDDSMVQEGAIRKKASIDDARRLPGMLKSGLLQKAGPHVRRMCRRCSNLLPRHSGDSSLIVQFVRFWSSPATRQ